MKKRINASNKMKRINKFTVLFLVLFPITIFSCNEDEVFVVDEEIIGYEESTLSNEDISSAQRDNVFVFDPERWGIVEGTVSDEVAKENTKILNFMMKRVAEFGIQVFQIDEMDAFFEVSSRVNNPKIKSESAILIPSNFELRMSDNVFLRVQPNNTHAYSLLMVFKGQNISVIGGNLIGDRWSHTYDPVTDLYGNTYNHHDWGHLLHISGGKNIEINGLSISDAMADGIVVHASNIRNEDGTPGNTIISENVAIKNSIINESRRNGLSLLDGDGILVENCKITNTGQGKNPDGVKFSSAGTWPKYGISFEAWRVREADGTLKEYEKIENVTLKGNNFTGNKGGDIVLFTCSKIIIEDNYFDSKIANKASNNIIIRNNVMEARINDGGAPEEHGILLRSLLDPFGNEFNHSYQIYGNKITGYKNALILSGENYDIHDNILRGFRNGIGIGGRFHTANFYNNNLETDLGTSYGYTSRGGDFKDINIRNEEVTVGRRPIDIYDLNVGGNNSLVFDNCTFISTRNNANNITRSENITIKNSTLNTRVDIVDSHNIQLINNN